MASYPDSSAHATRRVTAVSSPSTVPAKNIESAAVSLTRIGALLAQLTTDATLGELLAAAGYARSEIAAGTALHLAAEEQFNACERVQAACHALAGRRNGIWVKAQREFILFQARTALPGRIRSGAGARPPRARRQTVAAFVAEAEAAYACHGSRRYARLIAQYGFGPDRLRLSRELLRALQIVDAELREARLGLKRLHEARAVCLVMLNYWLQDLFRYLRVALGQTRHPPQAKALGGAGGKKHSAPKRRRPADC